MLILPIPLLRSVSIALLLSLAMHGRGLAVSAQEIAQRHRLLPTVAEKDLPPMKNQPEAFAGVVRAEGLAGQTWVRFPFVENPGSFGIDRRGRLFVAEVNRFWQGVADLRGVNEFIRGDFQSQTLDDRARLQQSIPGRFPDGFFTNTSDRLIRLEDRDGNGAADHRTLFSDRFGEALDGLGFSVLPEDDAVYFTCIPSLRRLTDTNDDGVADAHDAVLTGFGVRVSFIGHDLHGLVRGPDGRLYFSIGDRGYHVTTKEGAVVAKASEGAIFRCESDGSGFEVFCHGLRNPTELAFDEAGNLFTFDNNGDIGDVARMVYALEDSDSGWDMRHQCAHQYVEAMDWEGFHPARSMWVAERMFDTFNDAQPQWVYPPAAHVGRGPSGVTWVTGDAVPAGLRGRFLLADYGGAVQSCKVLAIGTKPHGEGYTLDAESVVAEGAGVSDVELGFDGRIYLCDFGGGWTVNTNGAIHTLTPTVAALRSAGAAMAERFRRGVAGESVEQLVEDLRSPDRRLRQMAQFALVDRGAPGHAVLAAVARDASRKVEARLHGVWGLGQIARRSGGEAVPALLDLARDAESEVRANAARALGDTRGEAVRARLLELLGDASPRVRSLAAIAVSRVAEKGDAGALGALYAMAAAHGLGSTIDPVLRHACLTALDRLGTVESAVTRASDLSRESRLMALLFLRRQASAELARFLADADPALRREAVRAIYDTAAVDTPAGEGIAALGADIADLPPTVQRRVVAANYRRGGAGHAQRLVQIASAEALDLSVREAALHALRLWEKRITTDPVLGGYRPIPGEARSMQALGAVIGEALKKFVAANPPPQLTALALKLADETGTVLDRSTLETQVANAALDAEVRVAALDSLVKTAPDPARAIVAAHLADPAGAVAAAALRHGHAMNLNGIPDDARRAVDSAPPPAARAGLDIIAASLRRDGQGCERLFGK